MPNNKEHARYFYKHSGQWYFKEIDGVHVRCGSDIDFSGTLNSYNEQCTYCWLGHAHTSDIHTRELSAYAELHPHP